MAELSNNEIQEAIDGVERLGNLAAKREIFIGAAGLGIGIAIGFAGGYFSLKKKMELRYEQFAEDEIEEMRAHYLAKEKSLEAQDKPDLDKLVERLGYRPSEGSGLDLHMVPPPQGTAVQEDRNVFTEPQPDVEFPGWDYANETKSRTETTPYILHRDEFLQGEKEYEQMTLTYFAGDETLCNVDDTVIDNADELVGLTNLQRFGHGSGDPNVLYVRNDALTMDIEVTFSDGKYAHQVMGFEGEDRIDKMPEQVRRDFDDGAP